MPPTAAKGDLGVAAKGLDVLAQRGHLVGLAFGDHRDGAMRDAGRHRLKAGGLDPAHHFFRERGGRDIDIADRLTEQRIAHGTADHARLLAVAVKERQQPRQRALGEPSPLKPARGHRRHFVCPGCVSCGLVSPGTSLPPSMWAGV